MERRGWRRSVLLLSALAALSSACTTPGTDQAVLAYRCANAPLQKVPSERPTSYEPVWRTYASAGYSLALPADWDGLALGTDHVQSDLAEAEKRSPQISDWLRGSVTDASDRITFLGIAAPTAVQLEVSPLPLGNGVTHCLARSLGLWQGWSFISGYHLDSRIMVTRAVFPAGQATILRFTTSSAKAYLANEHILLEVARQPLDLDFWVARSHSAGLEAVAWKIAESVRSSTAALPAAGPNPVRSCLYPDARPDFTKGVGWCPLEVGAPLARLDCTGYDLQAPASVQVLRYDVASGDTTGDARLDLAADSCSLSAPAGTGLGIYPAGLIPGDAVAIFDVRLISDGTFGAGLAIRQDSSALVYVRWSSSRVSLADQSGTGVSRTSRELGVAFGANTGPLHRLVLAVSGDSARAWFDGRSVTGTTAVPDHPGQVQAYVFNSDNNAVLSLGVMRFFVYAAA